MGSKASDSAMLKTWRRNPPSSSLVRLSQLANDKYESPPFSSGGHNWYVIFFLAKVHIFLRQSSHISSLKFTSFFTKVYIMKFTYFFTKVYIMKFTSFLAKVHIFLHCNIYY